MSCLPGSACWLAFLSAHELIELCQALSFRVLGWDSWQPAAWPCCGFQAALPPNPHTCTLPPPRPAVYAQTAGGAACPGTTLPTVNAPMVRQVVFPELAISGTSTVGALFNRCSYQKTRLNSTNSLVTDVVRLPCSGTT